MITHRDDFELQPLHTTKTREVSRGEEGLYRISHYKGLAAPLQNQKKKSFFRLLELKAHGTLQLLATGRIARLTAGVTCIRVRPVGVTTSRCISTAIRSYRIP